MKKQWIKRGTKKLKSKKGLKQRKALRKQGKQKISVLQLKLWELCKKLTRRNYPNICYTCGQTNLIGSNWQTGHLWAKGSLGAYLKYSLRVLRPQCITCNLHHGGMGAEFYRRMLEIEGKEYMEKLIADKQVTVNAYDHYEKLLKEYSNLLEK